MSLSQRARPNAASLLSLHAPSPSLVSSSARGGPFRIDKPAQRYSSQTMRPYYTPLPPGGKSLKIRVPSTCPLCPHRENVHRSMAQEGPILTVSYKTAYVVLEEAGVPAGNRAKTCRLGDVSTHTWITYSQ